MKKLYHGTILKSAYAIKRDGILPEINIANELDFGYGFYLGRRSYARTIAIEKARARAAADDYDAELDRAVIMQYRVDYGKLKADYPEGLVFFAKSLKFLRLVFDCRYFAGCKFLNVPFVYAPIADGFVGKVMKWYSDKKTPIRKAIALFRYWLPGNGKQLVLKNAETCKCVRLVRVIAAKGEQVIWEEE